jgi:VIT1/CCC1 family predicted Fe2+/Mn2+ transporter
MEKLTIKEAAAYYGKSESWVRKKILSGKLAAEKESFTYGERWITTEKALDDLAAELRESAKVESEVIEVRNVDRQVSKEEFLNEIEERNKKLIDQAAKEIKSELKNEIKEQNKLIENLLAKSQENKNKTLIDKIKQFFKNKFT